MKLVAETESPNCNSQSTSLFRDDQWGASGSGLKPRLSMVEPRAALAGVSRGTVFNNIPAESAKSPFDSHREHTSRITSSDSPVAAAARRTETISSQAR